MAAFTPYPGSIWYPHIKRTATMRTFLTLAILSTATMASSLGNAADVEPTRHPYQSFQSQGCGAGVQCTVSFPAITTGRTLLKRVSCDYFFQASSGAVYTTFLTVLDLSLPQPTIAFSDLQSFPYAVDFNGTTRFGINSDIYLFADKGQTIQLSINTSASLDSITCTLTGYYL